MNNTKPRKIIFDFLRVLPEFPGIPTVIANFYAAKPIKERFDKILEKQTVKDISGEVLSKGDITLDGINKKVSCFTIVIAFDMFLRPIFLMSTPFIAILPV